MTEPLPFNPNVSRGTSAVELCACNHANDHRGRKCGHENCQCIEGIRVDVATLRVMCDVARMLEEHNRTLHNISSGIARVLAIAEITSGLQTKPVVKENGGLNVEVARVKDTQPLIVVPK